MNNHTGKPVSEVNEGKNHEPNKTNVRNDKL